MLNQGAPDADFEGPRVVPEQADQLVDQQAGQARKRCREQYLARRGRSAQPADDQPCRDDPDQVIGQQTGRFDQEGRGVRRGVEQQK